MKNSLWAFLFITSSHNKINDHTKGLVYQSYIIISGQLYSHKEVKSLFFIGVYLNPPYL